MKITYYGHASFGLEIGSDRILVDPYITPNPLARHIDIDTLTPDFLLITHGHGDHVADAENIARKNKSRVISSFEIVTWFEQKGIDGHPMNIGGKVEFSFGTARMVTAVHSSVLPDGTYAANPGGFVIWGKSPCLYIAGDTALTFDMKLIPSICPKLDIAILPIGDNFTMGFEDAVIASDFIDCDRIIGCHYDTFDLIKIDKEAARSAFSQVGKELILMDIGQTIEILD
jgi:L-ascorbate metabolism protein UlaG (beta-lactamase superfamily)